MEFNIPKNKASIIKVIGVGGGGSNAVNHMYSLGIKGVGFAICNTDSQSLNSSNVPTKLQLGQKLTEGLGAGANPDVGRESALETEEDIKRLLEDNTKMIFITAGMGGGTGTGAAPVIAQVARDMNILTVGIATIPFSFEGKRRMEQAEEGIEKLREHVDTLLIINNDKLRDAYGNLKMSEAFKKADDILATAAKGIAEIITGTGYINVDFEDVKTVMKDGGTAIMSTVTTEGENRALSAATEVLVSPLLNDNEIKGSQHILINITSGVDEVTSDEVDQITAYIQSEAGNQADVIWGLCSNPDFQNQISVTVIATGFNASDLEEKLTTTNQTKVTEILEHDPPKENSVIEDKLLKDFFDDDFTSIASINKEEDDSETEIKEIENSENFTEEEADSITTSEPEEEPQFKENNENEEEESQEEEVVEEKPSERIIFGLEDSEEEIQLKENKLVEEPEENNKETTLNQFDLFPPEEKEATLEEREISEEKTYEGYSVKESEDTDKNFFGSGASYDGKLLNKNEGSNNESEKKSHALSKKLQSSEGVSELENTPAYLRNNIDLDKVGNSDYIVGHNEGLKKQSSFIDKSVD